MSQSVANQSKIAKGPRDWLTIAASITGAIGGIVALFTFTGFIVTLSFINELDLYGIPRFAEEFFKEAGVQFFSDFVVTLGENVLFFPAFVLIFVILLKLATSTREILSRPKKMVGNGDSLSKKLFSWINEKWPVILFVIVNLAITCMMLNLGKFTNQGDRKNFIFLVAVPGLIALSVYLIIHIAEITHPNEWGENAYGAFLLLFLILMVCIPLTYGRYVFDFPVHFSSGFEYDKDYDSEMMWEFRKSINEGGAGKVFYLMGHTSGKEVFFQAEKPPAKLILFDSEAVKFIRISRREGKPMTLRDILRGLEVEEGELPGDKGDEMESVLSELKKRP